MTDEPGRPGPRLLDAAHLPIAAYLAFIGAATITDPLTGHLPTWLSVAWSLSLLSGALLVVLGVAKASTRAESAGHGFLLFGIGFLIAVSLTVVDVDDLAAVGALAGVSILRLRTLARSREGVREARRILGGDR